MKRNTRHYFSDSFKEILFEIINEAPGQCELSDQARKITWLILG